MSNNDWKKRKAQAATRKMLEIAESNCGMHTRKITGITWSNSRLCVQFSVGDNTKQVNIAPQCRERFGRITKEVREKVEATKPEAIDVETSYTTYYQQNKVYNIGGIRYLYALDEAELDSWLDKAANQ